MVQAKLISNYAFFVLSLTMLGFAASGVILTLLRRYVDERLEELLALHSALFGGSLVCAMWAFYRAPTGEAWAASRAGFVSVFLYCGALALLFALPFLCCGVILGALLSREGLDARRVYCADLAGSACGALLAIPAIRLLGVEAGALALGVLLIVATAVATRAPSRNARLALVGAAGLLAAALLLSGRLFVMSYPPQSFLGLTQTSGSGYELETIVWDPVARIEVFRTPPPAGFNWPALIGENQAFRARLRRMLTQNNNAYAYMVDYDGRRESLTGIDETIYAAAYQASLVTRPRVLVIGVGGGFDVLTALFFDASRVTGVEINAATLTLLRGPYRERLSGILGDRRVELVHAEGRHYLARDAARYDVLQLSGVDSVSGLPGAAHVFSENYLYTAEAFDSYLAHLAPHGILNLMRPEQQPPRDMLRALAMMTQALRRAGASRPSDHVVVLASTNGSFTSLLVKRTPFQAAEVQRLLAWTRGTPSFGVAAAPGHEAPPNLYADFLGLQDERRERRATLLYPFDIRPVDDDRPFFFRSSYWGHLFSRQPVVQASIPVMEYGLLLLLGLTGLAALLCVYLPLRRLAREGQRVAHASRYACYFGLIGLGYLAVELALLQRFGLFLGHPNYSLSVVLAALLSASGLGALVSRRALLLLGHRRFAGYVLALLLLAEQLLFFPLLPRLITLPFAARAALVLAAVAPIGLVMGVFFPSALERLKPAAPSYVPWAWGLNGIFSVIAPILGVAVSMTWGISALLLTAVPVYLLAGVLLPEQVTAAPRP